MEISEVFISNNMNESIINHVALTTFECDKNDTYNNKSDGEVFEF